MVNVTNLMPPAGRQPGSPSRPGRLASSQPLRLVEAASGLDVTALSAALVDRELMAAWRRLYAAQPAPSNPFLAPAWVLGWYDRYVRPQDQVLLVVRRPGAPGPDGVVAIAPMHLHRSGVGPLPIARRLLPVGAGIGPNALEIPGLLCAPETAGQVLRALATACLKVPAHWAEIALTPEQGWFDRDWAAPPSAAMAFGEPVRPRACVVLPLQPTWEATRAGLKRNIKESIRRSANRLKKDGRPWHVVRRSSDLDEESVERFLRLHSARSAASTTNRHHPDAYRDDQSRQLMLDVLPELGRHGGASMFELYLDGDQVASQLALHAPGTSYVHSSGFREDTWALGVITHLQAELVRHAIDRGDTVVNFSPGPNVSKTRWSESLWITQEFAFGAGPRTLIGRHAVFTALSAVRTTLDAAAWRRSQTGGAGTPAAAESSVTPARQQQQHSQGDSSR